MNTSHTPARTGSLSRKAPRVVALAVALLLASACTDSPSPTGTIAPLQPLQGPSQATGGGGGSTKGLIAFVSNRDNPGGNEIYTIEPDGTGESRVTFLLNDSSDPTLSPDGRYIAFSSRPPAGDMEIHMMRVDGSGLAQLTFSPGQDQLPSWSKGSDRIAFVSQRDGNPEIYVMNADGSGTTRLTTNGATDWSPVWSPDGSRIAFVSDRLNPGSGEWELYTMDPDGKRVTRLTLLHAFIEHISWHPKGKQLVFSTTQGIYIITSDGSQLTPVVSTGKDGGWDPSWSPDGRRIVFTSDRTSKYELFTMDPDGSAQTQLTSTPSGANYRSHWGR